MMTAAGFRALKVPGWKKRVSFRRTCPVRRTVVLSSQGFSTRGTDAPAPSAGRLSFPDRGFQPLERPGFINNERTLTASLIQVFSIFMKFSFLPRIMCSVAFEKLKSRQSVSSAEEIMPWKMMM
jgi:hypothetical protein